MQLGLARFGLRLGSKRAWSQVVAALFSLPLVYNRKFLLNFMKNLIPDWGPARYFNFVFLRFKIYLFMVAPTFLKRTISLRVPLCASELKTLLPPGPRTACEFRTSLLDHLHPVSICSAPTLYRISFYGQRVTCETLPSGLWCMWCL